MKVKAPDLLLYHIKKEGLPMPDTEVKFHPMRKWRCDYLWKFRKLALEVEGGIFIFGKHNRPVSMIKEMEKYNELALHGYFLLRYTPQQVKSGEAVQGIKRFFNEVNIK